MRSPTRRTLAAVAAVIAAVVAVFAISVFTPPENGNVGSLARFVGTIRSYAQPDYEPASTPAELASQVDLVVRGTIVGVEPGQSYSPTRGGQAVIATSVLEIAVGESLGGDGSLIKDGALFVEIPHPAYVGAGAVGAEGSEKQVPFDHSAFAATVPLGAEAMFFVEDRTSEPYWPTVIDQGAGRPVGASITTPFPQGFLIEDAAGRLVSVMEPLEAMPTHWQGLNSLEDVSRPLTS
jgi:hypothetical protein